MDLELHEFPPFIEKLDELELRNLHLQNYAQSKMFPDCKTFSDEYD